VFVFGAKLRQQVFTARDYELNNLNRPTPMGNYAGRFFGQWNLFDSTQSWKALDRAKYMNFAANEQLNRTDQELVYQTVQAYYGVLLAQKQVQVVEDVVKTVEAIQHDSRARVESGLAVDSDLLSAPVQASGRQQELIERQNELALAQNPAGASHGCSGGQRLSAQRGTGGAHVSLYRHQPARKDGAREASRPEALGVGT
jgi:outer membrane protein TolC